MYEKLLSERPDAWKKVVPLSGDIGSPQLGLSEDDIERISDNVSIVFHLAATVQFNAPLQEAIQYNASGVRKVIELCKKIKKLEVRERVCVFYCTCTYVQ